MAESLYKCDLSTISEPELYEALKSFLRLDEPPEVRPGEGYLLDFTQKWDDSALQTVAAFANAFGGLLVVGVTDLNGKPEKLLGFSAKGTGEIKTQIASSIATNLVPAPFFEIGLCSLPTDTGLMACVIRVSTSSEICMYTKKGDRRPVFVRVEDQSLPADAAQLRSLIEREQRVQTPESTYDRRLKAASPYLQVWTRHSQARVSPVLSSVWFYAFLCPATYQRTELDTNTEHQFGNLVLNNFQWHTRLVRTENARLELSRGKDFVKLRLIVPTHDHERGWYLSTFGDIGFATQVGWTIESQGYWSIYDTAADLVFLLKSARAWWERLGYYGKFRLSADLCTLSLKPRIDAMFYHFVATGLGSSLTLDSTAIDLRPVAVQTADDIRAHGVNPVVNAVAELESDYAAVSDHPQEAVSRVVNQLLRGLGYAADLAKLNQTIRLNMPSEQAK